MFFLPKWSTTDTHPPLVSEDCWAVTYVLGSFNEIRTAHLKGRYYPHFADFREVRWLLQGHRVIFQPGVFAPQSLPICHWGRSKEGKVVSESEEPVHPHCLPLIPSVYQKRQHESRLLSSRGLSPEKGWLACQSRSDETYLFIFHIITPSQCIRKCKIPILSEGSWDATKSSLGPSFPRSPCWPTLCANGEQKTPTFT